MLTVYKDVKTERSLEVKQKKNLVHPLMVDCSTDHKPLHYVRSDLDPKNFSQRCLLTYVEVLSFLINLISISYLVL